MKDIEQLETLCKQLRNDRETLVSVENNIMKNIDVLCNICSLSRMYGMEKELENTIEGLDMMLESIKNYIKVMRCSAPPLVVHQDISQLISNTIFQYCKENNLHYRILCAPVKVVLDKKDKYYEPDIIVVFDSEKIKRDGCYGAPDIIYEIISKSTRKVDYEEKRDVYLKNGVKEYFVVDPIKKSTSIYCNEKEVIEKKFIEDFKMKSMPDLTMNIHNLLMSCTFLKW